VLSSLLPHAPGGIGESMGMKYYKAAPNEIELTMQVLYPSYIQMVLDEELIASLRRLMQGITVHDLEFGSKLPPELPRAIEAAGLRLSGSR